MKNFVVYMHVNKINGKKYVGITSQNPLRRWGAGEHYQGSPHFYRAIKKYGWECFEHIIVEANLCEEQAKNLEIALIENLNLRDPNFGYNISAGGQGNLKYTSAEEQAARKAYWNAWQQNYNKSHKEYFRNKNREYYKQDIDKAKCRSREYYRRNIQARKKYSERYKKEHAVIISDKNKEYSGLRKQLRAELLAIAEEHPEYFTAEELIKLSKRDTCRSINFLTELLNKIKTN